MPKLIFRGAIIRFVDLRYDEKSKTAYTKLNLTADFSEPVREAMEWGEMPEGITAAKLIGEMAASHFVLTPNGKELKQHELQLDAREIGGFEFAATKDGDELRFQVLTAVDGAAGLIEQYLRNIGKGAAQLRVNYEQQSEMPLQAEDEQQDRLITEEQAADTAADDGPTGPTLASATVIGVGTHQRGKKRAAEPVQ